MIVNSICRHSHTQQRIHTDAHASPCRGAIIACERFNSNREVFRFSPEVVRHHKTAVENFHAQLALFVESEDVAGDVGRRDIERD